MCSSPFSDILDEYVGVVDELPLAVEVDGFTVTVLMMRKP